MAEAIGFDEAPRRVRGNSVARQARGRRRRCEILEATLRVIARRGVVGVTHRAVAAEAGVPLASTTYYFASKSDLLAEAFRHHHDRQIAQIDEAAELMRVQQPSLEQAVAMVVHYMIALLSERRDELVAQHELHVEATRRPELRALCLGWHQSLSIRFEEQLERLGSTDPAGDAHLLLMAISGVQIDALSRGAERATAERLQPMLERLVRGLLATGSSEAVAPPVEPERAAS